MVKSSIEKLSETIGFEIGMSDDITQANLINGFCKGLSNSMDDNKLGMQLCYIVDKLDLKSHRILKELVHIPRFYIIGYDNFYFTTNNQLYNFRTKNVIRNRVKGTSSGYELDGKWITKRVIENLKTPVLKLSKNL